MPVRLTMKRASVYAIPDRIRDPLKAELRRRGRSLNDVVVEILANEYGVEYTPPKRKIPSKGEFPDKINLRMPAELHHKLLVHAATAGGTVRGMILFALAKHYNVAPEPFARLRPK